MFLLQKSVLFLKDGFLKKLMRLVCPTRGVRYRCPSGQQEQAKAMGRRQSDSAVRARHMFVLALHDSYSNVS
jgi:hypothetical protein